MRKLAFLSAAAIALALGACASAPTKPSVLAGEPQLGAMTSTQRALAELPPPAEPVAVAVYGFNDLTGQFKPSETGQTLSRAVSQGGGSILVKALQDAGQRRWFKVVERERLDNLLKERQIISEMRARYLGETSINSQALPPMLFAGIILEGGVIGFDTNTLTGGAGARFLGIGGDVKYRQDTVTVYLRAVSVKSGEVLASVTTSKTIASYGVAANAFRYVGFRELLEAEGGLTFNEPDQLALQQAVEKAVYALVAEGAEMQLWAFSDRAAGQRLLAAHRTERAGLISPGEGERLRQLALADPTPAPAQDRRAPRRAPTALAAAPAPAPGPQPRPQSQTLAAAAPSRAAAQPRPVAVTQVRDAQPAPPVRRLAQVDPAGADPIGDLIGRASGQQ